MWDAIITLIEKNWKERPRKKLISSVIKLRRNMKECQDWYDKYKSLLARKIDMDSITYPHPRVEWIRSLGELAESIMKVDEVMEIFSPETHKSIRLYHKFESLEIIADASFQELEKEIKESRDFDLTKGFLNTTFKNALEK